jgi:hypothetical protein
MLAAVRDAIGFDSSQIVSVLYPAALLSLSYDAMPAEYASVIITEFGATAAVCFLCVHHIKRFCVPIPLWQSCTISAARYTECKRAR